MDNNTRAVTAIEAVILLMSATIQFVFIVMSWGTNLVAASTCPAAVFVVRRTMLACARIPSTENPWFRTLALPPARTVKLRG